MRPEDVDELLAQLQEEVESVLPGSTFDRLNAAEIEGCGVPEQTLLAEDESGALVVGLRRDDIAAALRCTPLHAPEDRDIQFLKSLVRLFSHDLQPVEDLRRHREIWTSLRGTRFVRAIAHASAFSTDPLVAWLADFEAASGRTYESQPFSGSVIFTKQLEWVAKPVEGAFVKFRDPLQFADAMLKEKWVRPLLASGEVALVALGHSARVVGVVAFSYESSTPSDFAPHERLSGLYRYLAPGTMAVTRSANGDTFISLPNGLTFTKSQGQWRHRANGVLEEVLAERLDKDVSASILRLAMNLSFDRGGALFVILDPDSEITSLVPDHEAPDRVGRSLRGSVAGLSIRSGFERQVIGAIAHIDGAVVLDSDGVVVDAACMIAEPAPEAMARFGTSSLRRFPGARTTAAWSASFSGVAVKVSEDGPIEIYIAGELRARTG